MMIDPWTLAAGLFTASILLMGYAQGPGWLAHSECPHCCWCSGRPPFGDRVEKRLARWWSR